MDDSSQQQGKQLGEYHLGARYKNVGDLGRLYRARNSVTGAPALVLRHTERQAEDVPLADWTVRVTSSVAPAYLAVEVERAPEGGDPADVAGEFCFMFEDAQRAATTTLNRPETLPHLLSPRALPRAPRLASRAEGSWRRPALAAGLAALAAAALLHLGAPPNSGISRNMLAAGTGAELMLDDDAGWGGSAPNVAGDVVLTYTADLEPMVIGRPLPKAPFDNQKRPPCKVKEKLEVEINGGCWVPHETRAPCPEELYENGGKCYLPAAKPRTLPRALSRQPLASDLP